MRESMHGGDESPERKPKRSEQKPIEERAQTWIAEKQEKYSAAITNARSAAATTATEAWQVNYAEQMRFHREIVSKAVKGLQSVADTIDRNDSSEDTEKELGDAKKTLAEERVRHAAWRNRSVSPFENVVKACREQLESIKRESSNEEQSRGLIWHGLRDAVLSIISTWPTADWDDGSGVVSVKDPPAASAMKVN